MKYVLSPGLGGLGVIKSKTYSLVAIGAPLRPKPVAKRPHMVSRLYVFYLMTPKPPNPGLKTYFIHCLSNIDSYGEHWF